MIIVTGTKRSGTSMWMQILRAAGLASIGDAFPRDWARTIREANPAGFYESPFRTGIYFATNPNPRTGTYLHPDFTRKSVVKVFVPGLLRSDLAFLDRVVCTVRSVREYVPSLVRLYAMERENKQAAARARGLAPLPSVEHVPPWLEWWHDNYRLLRDSLLRGYPLRLISYARTLEQPEHMVGETLSWLGTAHANAAVAQVQSSLRTQCANTNGACEIPLERSTLSVFDELYARIHEQRRLDTAFLGLLAETQQKLEPAIRRAERRTRQSRLHVRELRRQRRQLKRA